MTQLKTDRESTIFSHRSDTFGMSQNLWLTLERLIQEAESLGIQAKTMIGLLENSLKNEEIAIICDEKLDSPNTQNKMSSFYDLVCGGKPSGGTAKDRCELFWNSIRIALYDQFRGFAVPDAESRKIIRQATVHNKDSGSYQLDPTFWKIHNDFDNKIGRIWFLVAYVKALQKDAETPRDFLENEFRQDIKNVLLKEYSRLGKVRDLKEWHSSDHHSRFHAARCFALWRLLKKLQKELFPESNLFESNEQKQLELDIPDDNGLILRLMLSLEAESAPSVEISLLLRVLMGRYLNLSPIQTEWTDTLRKGIRYILSRQNELDGSWELPMSMGPSSLFLHRFSPLLHVLDLDTELLQLEGTMLVEACERALASARRTLSAQNAALQTGLKKYELKIDSLVNAIVVGLSLGATIYDRLKDILSDSILRHLGAVDGNTVLSIEDISNSLNFQDNISLGVIRPWVEGSSRRPGAILIYGPPGTGKTTVAEIIASELNRELAGQQEGRIGTDRWRFLLISPANFTHNGSDGIIACAEQLFSKLKHVRRCVVLLDEMEEFLRARGVDSDRDSRLVTAAFLPLLQETVKTREIILVVATNFVGNIDAAVMRQGRFDLILPLGPPDAESRKVILESVDGYRKVKEVLDQHKEKIGKDDFEKAMVEYSMGYARMEIVSFFLTLWGNIKEEIESGKLPKMLADRCTLEINLWHMRTKSVPMALSGRAGSDWRTFEDEANRHNRDITISESEVRKVLMGRIDDYRKVKRFLKRHRRSDQKGLDPDDFEKVIVGHSLKYARTEIKDFFLHFLGSVVKMILKNKLPKMLNDKQSLENELQKISKTLSLRPSRDPKPEVDYWQEPAFPLKRNSEDSK